MASSIQHRIQWLYHESGIQSLYLTGRDAWFVILSRTCRMFAFGAVSLILALFFAELAFTDAQIGLFMTLTLAGDVAVSFFLTLVADSLGRRRVLLAGGLLMTVSGAVFVFFENFWVLLVAAVVGVISATGSDFGPFRAIEESVLSHLTTPKTRSDVLSWYITVTGLGSAVGLGVAGGLVDALKNRDGWDDLRAYHALFWVYAFMGLASVVLALLMSAKCEISEQAEVAARVGQTGEDATELAQGLLNSDGESDEEEQDGNSSSSGPRAAASRQETKQQHGKKSKFSQISAATRQVMYKLWFLLVIDSLADGMVNYALTIYYMDRKFQLPKSTLGSFMSATFILGSVSTVFAGPLARHIGLINTMVFTHLPSSAAVLLFPAPSGLVPTAALLFLRGGLNNLDQAPRAALIAAVVKPEERTAVMGITGTLRTLAAMIGPTITGGLADGDKFWVAFVVAGALRIAYDLGLWAAFVNIKLYAHETGEGAGEDANKARRSTDEESSIEMDPVQRQE